VDQTLESNENIDSLSPLSSLTPDHVSESIIDNENTQNLPSILDYVSDASRPFADVRDAREDRLRGGEFSPVNGQSIEAPAGTPAHDRPASDPEAWDEEHPHRMNAPRKRRTMSMDDFISPRYFSKSGNSSPSPKLDTSTKFFPMNSEYYKSDDDHENDENVDVSCQ